MKAIILADYGAPETNYEFTGASNENSYKTHITYELTAGVEHPILAFLFSNDESSVQALVIRTQGPSEQPYHSIVATPITNVKLLPEEGDSSLSLQVNHDPVGWRLFKPTAMLTHSARSDFLALLRAFDSEPTNTALLNKLRSRVG